MEASKETPKEKYIRLVAKLERTWQVLHEENTETIFNNADTLITQLSDIVSALEALELKDFTAEFNRDMLVAKAHQLIGMLKIVKSTNEIIKLINDDEGSI